MDLKRFTAKHLAKIEEVMVDFIGESTTNETLKESMLYSVQAGGKRIRPLLVLATLSSFSKAESEPLLGAYQTAAALEMIHTYSLIHDDLPAMDDDDLRRGLPTNHKKFGEAIAILAGDGLLTGAFQLMTEAQLEAMPKLLLIQLLSKAAGTGGMVAGQASDIKAEQQKADLETLIQIHREKTGALLTFAVMAGGILADQPETVIQQLQRFGQHLGLAFQIRDDLLDVVSTTEKLGKEVGRDAILEKSTYPELLGLAGAKKALAEELSAAERILSELAECAADFDPLLLQGLTQQFQLQETAE